MREERITRTTQQMKSRKLGMESEIILKTGRGAEYMA